jgi:hypothetical protein
MIGRRSLGSLVLATLLALTMIGTALAAPPSTRTGDRINLLFSTPETYPAGTAFHIQHGWCAIERTPPGRYRFDLFLNGERVRLRVDATERHPGCLWIKWYVANFPGGLPAGDHEFRGVWSEEEIIYEVTRVITFTS